jgi:hypothetical protein
MTQNNDIMTQNTNLMKYMTTYMSRQSTQSKPSVTPPLIPTSPKASKTFVEPPKMKSIVFFSNVLQINSKIENLQVISSDTTDGKIVLNRTNSKTTLELMRQNCLISLHLPNGGIATCRLVYTFKIFVIIRPSGSIYRIYLLCAREGDSRSKFTYKNYYFTYITRLAIDGKYRNYVGLMPAELLLSTNLEEIYNFFIDNIY